MTTEDIIIHIFCLVDDRLTDAKRVPQTHLYPSEIVTIGILFALKGGHFRGFYRWLSRDFSPLFAGLPDRTNLQRLLKTHQSHGDRLLAKMSAFTVTDSYPIELIFPIRQGRSDQQMGRKNKDKGRWSIGVKLCWLVNTYGRVVGWQWATMNSPDQDFYELINDPHETSIVLADFGFRSKDGVPDNLKLCPKGTWNERMAIETIFSMLTVICKAKKMHHRVQAHLEAHLTYLAAMFNVLLDLFHLLHPEVDPYKLSIAEFSL